MGILNRYLRIQRIFPRSHIHSCHTATEFRRVCHASAETTGGTIMMTVTGASGLPV